MPCGRRRFCSPGPLPRCSPSGLEPALPPVFRAHTAAAVPAVVDRGMGMGPSPKLKLALAGTSALAGVISFGLSTTAQSGNPLAQIRQYAARYIPAKAVLVADEMTGDLIAQPYCREQAAAPCLHHASYAITWTTSCNPHPGSGTQHTGPKCLVRFPSHPGPGSTAPPRCGSSAPAPPSVSTWKPTATIQNRMSAGTGSGSWRTSAAAWTRRTQE